MFDILGCTRNTPPSSDEMLLRFYPLADPRYQAFRSEVSNVKSLLKTIKKSLNTNIQSRTPDGEQALMVGHSYNIKQQEIGIYLGNAEKKISDLSLNYLKQPDELGDALIYIQEELEFLALDHAEMKGVYRATFE